MYEAFLPGANPASGAAFMAEAVGTGNRGNTQFVTNFTEGDTMLQNISILLQPGWKKGIRYAALAVLELCLAASLVSMFAQQADLRTFASAEDAGRALF